MAQREYKKLTPRDNATTTTGRVTFPVGTSVLNERGDERQQYQSTTAAPEAPLANWRDPNRPRERGDERQQYTTNPSTAAVGQLSGGNGRTPGVPTGGSLSGDKQGVLGSNPTAAVYNTVSNWLQTVASGFNSPPKVYPQFAASFPNQRETATQSYIAGEKDYTSLSGGGLSGDKQGVLGRGGVKTTSLFPGSPYSGTAGMYTYGQFSDPDEAFSELLRRNVPTNIPDYMAERLGLTPALQDPQSGWKLVNGNWVDNIGTSPYSEDPGYIVKPTIGFENFQNIGGPQNSDFRNTATYQYNVANKIPFTQQLRWDAARGKYITVGQWLKERNDREMKEQGTWKARRENREDGGYLRYDTSGNSPIKTGRWGVINFNVASG